MPAIPAFVRRIAAAASLLIALSPSVSADEPLGTFAPPLSQAHRSWAAQNPDAFQELLARMPQPAKALPAPRPVAVAPPASGTWTPTTNPPPASGLSNPVVLTDGTVLVYATCTGNWYKLTPDPNSSFDNTYINGTWSQVASLPSGYQPRFFASAVLPDGRFIVEGGEYNTPQDNCQSPGSHTTLGAIYDPTLNKWTTVSPPTGWTTIGDASSIVLANGTYMLSNCCTAQDALLNPANLTWTLTGTNKIDGDNNEEGWTLLPNGNVLTVDAYVNDYPNCPTGTNPFRSEVYNPGTGGWSDAGSTIVKLPDCGPPNASYEMGPQVLRPDGTVVAFGATTSGVANTAIYNSTAATWSAGPTLPVVNTQDYNLADAPAALLNNGNILFAASPGLFSTPVHFFELSSAGASPANTITQVGDTTNAPNLTSFDVNFVVLPTGQILETDFTGTVEIYQANGGFSPSWQPTITSAPANIGPGGTYQITGTQLAGLSQGAAYGDDAQANTNYPLVLIQNVATSHSFFARTFNWSTSSVAPGASGSVSFAVRNAETGPSRLYIIANGITSQSSNVTVFSSASFTLSASTIGSGTVTSAPSGINCGSTCSASFPAAQQVALTATPASGFSFAGWSGGGCSGTGGCTVTMNSAQSVSANFSQLPSFALSVATSGSGTVTSADGKINCGSACNASYPQGTQVSLTAAPASGFSFAGWSGGGCSGTGGCAVTMNSVQSVTASFTQNPPPSFTLSVSNSGNGTVTSADGGINCGATCSASYVQGTQVSLTATAASGFSFAGWNGGGCSGTGSCTVSMTADMSVTATFAQTTFGLSVNVSGTGRVTSSPAGIDCPGTCSTSFAAGTRVTLAESAGAGFGFVGWGGACSGLGTCALTLSAATTVSASFNPGAPPASPLVAAILPASRSVQVGNTATAFAAIINTGATTVPACAIAPSSSIAADFVYQTTDPSTNALTGSANTPADIPAGGLQTFVIGLTPTAPFGPANVQFNFACANVAPAPSEIGLNTLLLSASAAPIPDIVALAATTRNDGIVHVPGSSGTGVFAVATVNVGSSAAIIAATTTGSAELPVAVTLCQTDQSSGLCLAAPAASVTTQIAANATPTFGIFVAASGAVPFDPANSRIFVQFSGLDGTVRGATSVAVTTQ